LTRPLDHPILGPIGLFLRGDMRKGELTREHIIEQAAGVFNRKGFAGASLSDVMEATGLQKGGIYRHFGSKEELAAEAFAYAARRMGERFREALEGKRDARERLRAIIAVYERLPLDPPVPGGCPVLSAAVESDYGSSPLRDRVRQALDGLRTLVRQVVERGMARGEIRAGTDPERVATVLTATLEGAIMLTQLYDDPGYVRAAAAHLDDYVERELSA
jgi:TetR/AcrR family transcriptional regulator, transcriptional repressor for nem operon